VNIPLLRPAAGLAAASLGLSSAPLDASVTSAFYNNNSDYGYRVTFMPDLDQRRAASADGSVNGLTNNGTVACVPTSCTNMLTYITNHGHEDFFGTPTNWNSDATATKNAATTLINNLGNQMNCNWWVGGTTPAGMQQGLVAAVDSEKFNIVMQGITLTATPTIDNMMQAAAGGGVVSLCYGFYNNGGNAWDGNPILIRNGGHCVTLAQGWSDNVDPFILVRDPWTNAANSVQSGFVNRRWSTRPVTAYGWNNVLGNYTNLQNVGGTLTNQYLDSFAAITPKAGVSLTWDLQDLLVFLPALDRYQIIPLPFPLPDPPMLRINPWHNKIYMLAKLDDRLQLWRYLIDLDEWKPFEIPGVQPDPDPRAVFFNRDAELVIVSKNSVHRYKDLGDRFLDMGVVELPQEYDFQIVSYDNATDAIFAMDLFKQAAFRIDASGHGSPQPLTVDQMHLICDPHSPSSVSSKTGELCVLDRISTAIWTFRYDESTQSLIRTGVAQNIDLMNAEELIADDNGLMTVAIDGKWRSFEFATDGFLHERESAFSGMAAQAGSDLSRHFTAADLDLMKGPEWENVAPEFSSDAQFRASCDWDFDFDHRVGVSDLLYVIDNWGAEGLIGDGSSPQVGVTHLLAVINAWGTCSL
jgi:hypothetical protein